MNSDRKPHTVAQQTALLDSLVNPMEKFEYCQFCNRAIPETLLEKHEVACGAEVLIENVSITNAEI